jgi:hypothetical protein
MFDSVFESLKKATDVTVEMQQELFKKWASLWPGPTPPAGFWGEQGSKFQRKWAEAVEELLKKQREALEGQLTAGLQNLEAAFRLAEASDLNELRTRTVELWQKSFDCLKQTLETQAREFQAAANQWKDVMTKGAA